MKHKRLASIILLAVTLLQAGLPSVTAEQPEREALVKIAWESQVDLTRVKAAGIPVYARLTGDDGPFFVAGARPAAFEALQAQGMQITVLDPDPSGALYYLAYPMPGWSHPDWKAYGRMLLDDGAQVLLRTSARNAERLAEIGIELSAVSLHPSSLHLAPTGGAIPVDIDTDPVIQGMIDQVNSTTLYNYMGDLSGEWQVDIRGQPYTIATRHTESGEPIQKATQFVGDHLTALGLDVDYHFWDPDGPPNVVGELEGWTAPEDVYIICAHIDDLPSGPVAPGADDNASGAAAVLTAADILTQYRWGCTLRFAFWTGEEQGQLGSQAYAQRAHNMGENILGVLNLDMIGYNSDSSPIVDLHARSWLLESVALANLFADVVYEYDIDLEPDILVDNWLGDYSDNRSFWDQDYAAILAIEDGDDFSPYWHTTDDTLSTLDLPYHSEFVRASVGTFAHMSNCLLTGLEGHVTEVGSGIPIPGAMVTMQNGSGQVFSTLTYSDGYYFRSLGPETYSVTASADGYVPVTIDDVSVITYTITHQDFELKLATPILFVDPPSLTATLHEEGVINHTLWLTNEGLAELEFFLYEDSYTEVLSESDTDLPWLSEVPTNGTIAPGTAVAVTVTFDSGGLEPGVYLGFLDVESNDPATPHLDVPVSLTFQPFYQYLPMVVRGW